MGSRLIAAIVVVVATVALIWVVTGDRTTDVARLDAAAPAAGDVATGEPVAAPISFPEPDNFGPRPDLVDIDAWLQTDATSIDDFDGAVLLVEMWTFGCFNCKARIPYNQGYLQEFAGENFAMLGVHAPEFSHEADFDNIVAALDRLDVTWPQALDTSKTNFRSWQPGTTSYWPRTYVIDQNGDIRLDHIGEGAYDEVRDTIRWLLDNPADGPVDAAPGDRAATP